MSKETLLKIGQIGCTAIAGFLGTCLMQMHIDEVIDKRLMLSSQPTQKRMRTNSGPLFFSQHIQPL